MAKVRKERTVEQMMMMMTLVYYRYSATRRRDLSLSVPAKDDSDRRSYHWT
jgi:hypothetical protein